MKISTKYTKLLLNISLSLEITPNTYHICIQLSMNIIEENIPPELYQIIGMTVIGGYTGGFRLGIVMNQPGLHFTSEMQNLNFISELFKGGQITVRSIGGNIVQERQTFLNVTGGPVGEVLIEQTLITAIKTAIFHGIFHDFIECSLAGFVDKHTGIETIGPAYIGSGREFFAFKQFITIL